MAPWLGTLVSTPNLPHLSVVVSVPLLAAVSLLLVGPLLVGRNNLPNHSISHLPSLLLNYRRTLCPFSSAWPVAVGLPNISALTSHPVS